MGLTIGQGLAQFGENRRKNQEHKDNLKIAQGNLKLRQDMFEQEMMEKQAEREQVDRAYKIRSDISDIMQEGIDPRQPSTSTMRDLPVEDTTQIPFDAPETRTDYGRSQSDFWADALSEESLAKHPKSDPIMANFEVPLEEGEKATSLLETASSDVKPKRKSAIDFALNTVKESQNKSLIKRLKFLSTDIPKTLLKAGGLAMDAVGDLMGMPDDELIKKVGELSRQEKKAEKATKTMSLPTTPVGVEKLPEQTLASEFLAGVNPQHPQISEVEGELQGPKQQEEIITKGALKTPVQKRQEMMKRLHGAGLGELEPQERKQIMEEFMMGQISEEQQMEMDLDNSRLELNKAQIDKILTEMNPNHDPAFKFTEAQQKLSIGHGKMRRGSKGIHNLLLRDGTPYDPSTPWSAVEDLFQNVPFANFATDDDKQAYRVAGEEWVYGLLRPESGATIKADEMDSYLRTYIPQPGDSPRIIALKLDVMKEAQGDLNNILSAQHISHEDIAKKVARRSGTNRVDVMSKLKTTADIDSAVKAGSITPQQGASLSEIMNANNEQAGMTSGTSGKYTWKTNP